jgi:hypothetical protein
MATNRAPRSVADGTRYYRDATTGTGGTLLTFPGGGGIRSISIYNEDGSNALLVKFIRFGKPLVAEELTAPADATWSEVQSIPAGETFVFDVPGAIGLVWDRAAGSGAFTLRVTD